MTIGEVVAFLDGWAPPAWAESYDNVGLLWGDARASVRGVLTTLDLTPAVHQEAREVGANLILVHHPIWFGNRTRLDHGSYADRLIYQLIRDDIAVYAAHTNADQARDGVSYALCEALGLRPLGFLKAVSDQHGMGYIGEWQTEMPVEHFWAHVRQRLELPVVRHSRGRSAGVRRVAVCGGAGSFLLPEAIHAGVEAFLTADIPYHRFFEAEGQVWLGDIGHFESERFIARVFAERLKAAFPQLPVYISRIRTNPIHYAI